MPHLLTGNGVFYLWEGDKIIFRKRGRPMECPACGFLNLEEARFCNQCGTKLEKSCPACGQVNPPGSKFCHACGAGLTKPPDPIFYRF